jgi:hypothetical protein
MSEIINVIRINIKIDEDFIQQMERIYYANEIGTIVQESNDYSTAVIITFEKREEELSDWKDYQI